MTTIAVVMIMILVFIMGILLGYTQGYTAGVSNLFVGKEINELTKQLEKPEDMNYGQNKTGGK